MNDDHTCIPNSQLNNPMPTTPTSMPYYSDPIVAATHGTPPLTTSVSTAAAGPPSVSSRSFGESHNSNNTTIRDINNARDVKLGTNNDITDAGDVKIGTSKQTTFNQHTTNFIDCSNGSNKNNSARIHNDGTINFQSGNGNRNVKQSICNTNFNQHTTNFIVCFSDPLKPFV
uniref:Uncharacterized protein n=1 Tax=Panagrolaimus davidi TaxID=227884 RepID=A0A914Q9X7_9BILA